jgi:hypothetical protein
VTEAQEADARNPMPRILSWVPLTTMALWCIAQPLIDGLQRYPRWFAISQWFVGLALIYAVAFGFRYKHAAPYRSMLSAARVARPGSFVYGIRLDPLTTPVGVEWGDSRMIRWGFFRAARDGVEIVRSDGVTLLVRPWNNVEFSARGIDVTSGPEVEEWWFRVTSELGPWARAFHLHFSQRDIARMRHLRDETTTGP